MVDVAFWTSLHTAPHPHPSPALPHTACYTCTHLFPACPPTPTLPILVRGCLTQPAPFFSSFLSITVNVLVVLTWWCFPDGPSALQDILNCASMAGGRAEEGLAICSCCCRRLGKQDLLPGWRRRQRAAAAQAKDGTAYQVRLGIRRAWRGCWLGVWGRW